MSIRVENRDPIDFSDIATGAHWSHRIVLNPEIQPFKVIQHII